MILPNLADTKTLFALIQVEKFIDSKFFMIIDCFIVHLVMKNLSHSWITHIILIKNDVII